MKYLPTLSLLLVGLFATALPVSAVTITPTPGLPKLYSLTPQTAVLNKTIWFAAKYSDNDTLKSCDLYLNEKFNKKMDVKRDVVIASVKFTTKGQFSLVVKCEDTDGNKVDGNPTAVTVSDGSSYVNPGDIIKMGCPAVVYPNHPCTAVYYYGVDGKRHAFSNEKIYKSWFSNFDKLIILSEKAMSDISLGKNVTYRPGKIMVKFTTNSVYAVSYAGFLRPIANAEIAESIYGKDWVSLIEGVDDVFFGNYRIGERIESTNDFNWSAARTQTTIIDKMF